MKNTTKHEYISALMDGELLDKKECQQTIDELLQNEDAKKAWQEYHLIRDCLQNHQGRDLYKNIHVRLLQEKPLQQVCKKWQFAVNDNFYRKTAAIAAGLLIVLGVWNLIPNSKNEPVINVQAVVSPVETTDQQLTNVSNINKDDDNLYSEHIYIRDDNLQDANMILLDNPYIQAHQKAMNTNGLMRVSASSEEVY
ncbi:MAG: sigma-E factor negative regulatory protein [Neisseriaceae bacterium]|nr:sigma-E factor negative regulatory protein [Neisseriaceae bacterium]